MYTLQLSGAIHSILSNDGSDLQCCGNFYVGEYFECHVGNDERLN